MLSLNDTPESYARKLVRYHKDDPSFVRSMVLREFGRAPRVAVIRRFIAENEKAPTVIRDGKAPPRKPAEEELPPNYRERSARMNQIAGCKTLLRKVMALGGHR